MALDRLQLGFLYFSTNLRGRKNVCRHDIWEKP